MVLDVCFVKIVLYFFLLFKVIGKVYLSCINKIFDFFFLFYV